MLRKETSLSVAEAILEFEKGAVDIRMIRMLINDIGIAATQGNAAAADFLGKILLEPTTDTNCKKTAFCVLNFLLPKALPETNQVLQQFIKNPDNTEFIDTFPIRL